MDFELTEDQHQLQEVVRDVASRECPAGLVRELAEGGAQSRVDRLWSTFVELDWPALTVPIHDGGMGATAVELVIAVEELGRVADPTPFIATASEYVPMVRECFTGSARRDLLEEVCAGTTGAAGFDPGGLTAESTPGGWRLSGSVQHVIDGDRAERLALVAQTDEGPAVFVLSSLELRARRTPTFDATLHLAEVTIDEATVPDSRVARGEPVSEGIEKARMEAVTCLSASMVGASQRILEMTLEHVRDRHQFGVPIGSFQAVKHMAVDVYVAIERARAMCHFAALTLAESDDRAPFAAAMAKAAAGDAQRIAAGHGIQLFGGLGFTWENDLQLFVRRAMSGEPLLGSTVSHRAAAARLYRPTTIEAGRP